MDWWFGGGEQQGMPQTPNRRMDFVGPSLRAAAERAVDKQKAGTDQMDCSDALKPFELLEA